MRVKDCIQQIRERGDARVHECSSVNVGLELGLASRSDGMFGEPCDEGAVYA